MGGGVLSFRHESNPLSEHINYNIQTFDDPTIQHFMWGDSSELKLENNKGSGSNVLHDRNKVAINGEKWCV